MMTYNIELNLLELGFILVLSYIFLFVMITLWYKFQRYQISNHLKKTEDMMKRLKEHIRESYRKDSELERNRCKGIE